MRSVLLRKKIIDSESNFDSLPTTFVNLGTFFSTFDIEDAFDILDMSDLWRDLDSPPHSETDLIYQLDHHRQNIHRETDIIKLLIHQIQTTELNWYWMDDVQIRKHFQEMWKLYYQWKDMCIISDSHDNLEQSLLYYLSKLCFYVNIEDSEIVVKLLKQIYDCYGNFKIFYYGMVILDKDWKTLFHPGKWPILHPTFTHDPLTYFVHHGNKSRYIFNGYKMIDYFVTSESTIPNYFYVLELSPDLFLLFSRYGALSQSLQRNESIQLLRYFITILGNKIELDSEDMRVEMIKIMLRIIPQAKITTINLFDLTESYNTELFWEHVIKLDTKILPGLSQRFKQPSRLKHLCRCVVRSCLFKTWNLPDGISRLQIPICLHSYLDLIED